MDMRCEPTVKCTRASSNSMSTKLGMPSTIAKHETKWQTDAPSYESRSSSNASEETMLVAHVSASLIACSRFSLLIRARSCSACCASACRRISTSRSVETLFTCVWRRPEYERPPFAASVEEDAASAPPRSDVGACARDAASLCVFGRRKICCSKTASIRSHFFDNAERSGWPWVR